MGTTTPPDVRGSARLGPVELRNQVIKAATFEDMTPRGLVTDELIECHLRPARGDVGMTSVAYCAVSPEGRTDPQARSLCIHCNKCMPIIYTGTRCVFASPSGRKEPTSGPA